MLERQELIHMPDEGNHTKIDHVAFAPKPMVIIACSSRSCAEPIAARSHRSTVYPWSHLSRSLDLSRSTTSAMPHLRNRCLWLALPDRIGSMSAVRWDAQQLTLFVGEIYFKAEWRMCRWKPAYKRSPLSLSKAVI